MSKSSLNKDPLKSVANPIWINPCNLPFYITPSPDNLPEAKDIYEKIIRRAVTMKGSSERVKRKFIAMLGDEDFEEGLSNLKQEWLPEVDDSAATVDQVEEAEAFRKSFQFLQYFAVGMEQIILDQVLHEGSMLPDFKEISDHLNQLLCEVQLGMWYRGVSPDSHVGQEVMAQDYRDIGDSSRRLIRDYLIVRDLVKLSQLIGSLFSQLESRL